METLELAQQIKLGVRPVELELINQWIEDGKGVAVYENVDLGHPECGHRQYLTVTTFKDGVAPETLPDFPDRINWRYRLVGIYTGPVIS